MNVAFRTKQLADYYQCLYSGKQPFAEPIIKGYRKVVKKMLIAENINMLSKFRSLNIEKYQKHWSARINNQFRVEFDYIKPDTIHIIKISKHYE